MNIRRCLGIAALLAVASCGGGSDLSFWNDAVNGLSVWEDVSVVQKIEELPEENAEPREITEKVGSRTYACTVKPASFEATPKEFAVIDPDQSVIWLGNLIQGKSHYAVGSLEQLSIPERAPLKISIDLLRGENTKTIENPSLTSVQSAIGGLVDTAVQAGHEASSTIVYDWEMAHSTSEATLRLGFAGEYLGASASAALDVESSGEEKSFIAYFLQRAFTVSMELPPEPAALLSADFKAKDLEGLRASGAFSDDNPPVYISSITYGRILTYRMTSSHSEERIRAAIQASYDGSFKASGYAESDIKDTLANAKISIASFGGKQENVEALIRSGKLKDYFTGDTKLTSMEPISFELRSVADNRIAQITRTTEYEVKECRNVSKPIGETVTVYFEKFNVPGDCDVGVNAGDLFGRLDLSYTNTAGKIATAPIFSIGESGAKKIQSGNDLTSGGKPVRAQRIYGKTFRLKGELKDADKAANGKNDQVGAWSFNLPQKKQGKMTKRAHGSTCYPNNANQPLLYYRIEREGFLYPPEE